MYQLCSGWDYAHFLSWSMWSPKSLLHSKDLLALLSVHLFDIPVQRLHNLLYHIQDFHLIPENCPAIRSQNAVHLQQQIFQLASVCVWCPFSKVKTLPQEYLLKPQVPNMRRWYFRLESHQIDQNPWENRGKERRVDLRLADRTK